MTDLIRSASLTHYAGVARSVGIDPTGDAAKVTASAALPRRPGYAHRGRQRPPAAGSLRRASGVEDFGLRLADRGGFSTLGPVALVVREQATVGAAIEALSRYIHIQNEAMRLEIDHGR